MDRTGVGSLARRWLGGDGGGSRIGTRIVQLPVDAVVPGDYQPRWDAGDVEELSASIKEHGLLQPLVVRKVGSTYQIVAGERRLRAARAAGLKMVPAVIAQCSEAEAAVLSLVENLQRQELSPVEEAEGYRRILAEFHLTQEELARRLGVSQATVANRLRLLRLPEEVRDGLHKGLISERHGRALLRLSDDGAVLRAFRAIVAGELRVQEAECLVEQLVEEGGGGKTGGERRKRGRPRLGALRDMRILLNTFRVAVDTLRRAGVPAEMEQRQTAEALVVTVRVPMGKRAEAGGAGQKVGGAGHSGS